MQKALIMLSLLIIMPAAIFAEKWDWMDGRHPLAFVQLVKDANVESPDKVEMPTVLLPPAEHQKVRERLDGMELKRMIALAERVYHNTEDGKFQVGLIRLHNFEIKGQGLSNGGLELKNLNFSRRHGDKSYEFSVFMDGSIDFALHKWEAGVSWLLDDKKLFDKDVQKVLWEELDFWMNYLSKWENVGLYQG